MRPLFVSTPHARYPICFSASPDSDWRGLANVLKQRFPKNPVGIVTSPTVAERYLEEYRRARLTDLPLAEAHEAACALAERWLPLVPPDLESPHADAQRG
jgi:hypothetical protein